jgi:hypothetical protein
VGDVDGRLPEHPVAGPGGGWVSTLYRNADHGPFIHALNARDRYAFCVDLPTGRRADQQAARLWTLVRDSTGGGLYAVNTALGLVSEIDQEHFTVARTASFPPDRVVGGAAARPGAGGEPAAPRCGRLNLAAASAPQVEKGGQVSHRLGSFLRQGARERRRGR